MDRLTATVTPSVRFVSRAFLLLLCLSGAVSGAEPIVERLVRGNDETIACALTAGENAGEAWGARSEAVRLLVLTCGYVAPSSRYHGAAEIAAASERIVRTLAAMQAASGLFDSGNLESPPDTGFIVEALARALILLRRDGRAETAVLRSELGAVITRAARGVAAGGVHTPNHRWGVCAALALAHALDPDPRYAARIDEWLAEGIDQDADGQFSERSPAYSANVVNPALLTLAELHGRNDFVERVRRNVVHALWLTEANGELVTVASRRQDQHAGARVSIAKYYLPARWLARHMGDREMAALARWIEADFFTELIDGPFDPNWPLPMLLTDAVLAGVLPEGGTLPTDFTIELPGSGLVRWRRGAQTATLYGGSDHASGLGVGSGLAMNPTFFVLRQRTAQLALRLTPAFFGTGFFHSAGVARTPDGGWRLHQRLAVPYHQPLLAEWRRADGDYALSADGRFFSKMDFSYRPKDERVLETEIVVRERAGSFELEFNVSGHPGVPVTLELACTGAGELAGATPLAELVPARRPSWLRRGYASAGGASTDFANAFALPTGTARWTVGGDAIEFGPGSFASFPGRMEGEDYTWVNGHLRAEGQRVYFTGRTPWRHTLTLRAATKN